MGWSLVLRNGTLPSLWYMTGLAIPCLWSTFVSCFHLCLSRIGFESHVLRYAARLVDEDTKVDTKRKFVVSFFLIDDTILVNEVREQNSGGP